MSFLSGLKKFGQEALHILTLGAIAAETAAPLINEFAPGYGSLVTAGAQLVLSAETAGASIEKAAPGTDTSTQKAALVVSGLAPLCQQFCQKMGFSTPTAEQIQKFNDIIVAGLNVFGTVQAEAATTQAAS